MSKGVCAGDLRVLVFVNDHTRPSAQMSVLIENDRTGDALVASYDVTFDSFADDHRQVKARIESWDREARTGIELVAEAFRQIEWAESDRKIDGALERFVGGEPE